MKKVWLSLLLVLGLAFQAYPQAGSWTTNNFMYKPPQSARGLTEYNTFHTGFQRVDTHLGAYKTLGDPGYTTLAEAITTAGSNTTIITVPIGTWASNGLTVPSNISLILRGGIIDTGTTTTTINGPIYGDRCLSFAWSGSGKFYLGGSPSPDLYPEWFGGFPGVSNNCTAAFAKLNEASQDRKTAKLGSGVYRIATPLVITSSDPGQGLRIEGGGRMISSLYIDVNSPNDGITFDVGSFHLRSLSVLGKANCARYGIYVDQGQLFMDGVNMLLGSTSYALAINYWDYIRIEHLDIGHHDGSYADSLSCVRPHDGIGFINVDAPTLTSNVGTIQANITSLAGTGIYVNAGYCLEFTGSIEACGTDMVITGTESINNRPMSLILNNMNMGEGSTNGLLVDNVSNLVINGGLLFNASFNNCLFTNINGARFGGTLDIAASCRGTVLNGVTAEMIHDQSPDTFYTSPAFPTTMQFTTFDSPGQGVQNIMRNTGFDRWTSSTVPCGWSTGGGTWAGEVSDIHNTEYCASFNTNGDNRFPGYTLPADDFINIKGQLVNGSLFVKVLDPGGGDVPANFPRIFIDQVIPAFTSSTLFKVGDMVEASAAYKAAHGDPAIGFRCITAGTSGSEPTSWPTAEGRVVTDGGGVVWVSTPKASASSGPTPLVAADIGKWKKMVATQYIARNAISFTYYLGLWKGATHNITYKLSEPALMVGGHSPRGYVRGRGDMSVMFLNGLAIVADTVIPSDGSSKYNGEFFKEGDLCFQKGGSGISRCTAEGTPGTWSAF